MTDEVQDNSKEKLAELLKSRVWRLTSGKLYKIIVKGDDESDEGLVMPFVPNRAQRRLMARLHNRNVILKARQLGFTTLVAIMWLDTALFSSSPIRCGIIAQDQEAAEAIFQDKVKFAYENLPEFVRAMCPLSKDSATQLRFAHNGASIRVATSMRSGTIHRLHVSELGKIAAKYPEKAKEVITGSIPAVPKSGMLIIESTAEGQEGAFFDITQLAMAKAQKGGELTEKDYRFHFFAWWEAPEYVLDPDLVLVSEADHKYFAEKEVVIGRKLPPERRAWYVATRDSEFSGDPTLMWQEYPTTPAEAFQVSTEGCYYSDNLALARKQGRVMAHLPVEAVPVNTFWDVGRGDMTTIWFHQRVGPLNRFIRYYEQSGEEMEHFAKYLQDTGYTFGKHYLPHDANHKRMGLTPDTNRTVKEMLETLLPGHRVEIVPRVTFIQTGIQATRNVFSSCEFDETGCKDGMPRLQNYRKRWNKQQGCWSNEPVHDDNSHGADAFRQFGQEADAGNRFPHGGVSASQGSASSRPRRRGSAMAV